jgi:hypothetical protein
MKTAGFSELAVFASVAEIGRPSPNSPRSPAKPGAARRRMPPGDSGTWCRCALVFEETMTKVFPSKIDTWIAIVIAVPPISTAISAIFGLINGVPAAAIGLVFVALLYAAVIIPLVRYEIEDDALVIRFGMIRSRVPYAGIKRIVPTKSILSSPALSLDRLHLDSGNALGPYVSPADKEGFLAAIAEKAPQLKREGDSLVPR